VGWACSNCCAPSGGAQQKKTATAPDDFRFLARRGTFRFRGGRFGRRLLLARDVARPWRSTGYVRVRPKSRAVSREMRNIAGNYLTRTDLIA